MEELLAQFERYVTRLSGIAVTWHGPVVSRLPQYLAQLYELHRISAGNRYYLGIVVREPGDFQPSRFTRQLARLMETGDGKEAFEDYCLIAGELPAYVRQRLVQRQIPFAVPGRQLNWPALGAAVQEARTARRHGVAGISDRLMPATQVVILHALNTGETGAPLTPKALARRLGYTPMTMSRALDEIEARKLGRVLRAGRERVLEFPRGRKVLWEEALDLLRNPVRDTVRVWWRELPANTMLWAEESALANYSLLAEPGEPVLAVGRHGWKPLAKRLQILPIPEEDSCRLQVWRYDPGLLARGAQVDPFSLYLSLRDEHDERVQLALEDMMEQVAWSED